MSPEIFEHLLQLTGLKLSKGDTRFRKSIPVAERLTLTLRFLASSDSQKSLSFVFRIRIKETCIVLRARWWIFSKPISQSRNCKKKV